MLDTETTFDQLVQTYALSEEQSERILANRFYRNIAGALSGTQEYMAMEKLYELHDRGGFDLIVVDTPPTRHALDFLDAPRRLTRMLDNRIFRMLMVPTRRVVRVGTVAAQAFLRTISRVVGTEAVDDVVSFFRAFEGMEEGFRDRANQVMQLLAADETAFVLVTSPRRDAVEEAEFFAARLADGDFAVDALVVNRVHPHYCDADPATLRERVRRSSRPAPATRRPGSARGTPTWPTSRTSPHASDASSKASSTASATRRSPMSPSSGHDVHDFTALACGRRPPDGRRERGARFSVVSTILVAADAKWVRDLVKSACTASEQTVIEVTRGQDVRDLVGDRSPELVILDMQIANMGGLAVAIDLRLEGAAGRIPDVSILLLLDREADRFLAKRVDADAELVKPVDPGTLRRTVDRLLAREVETVDG